jgi:hypothetical protein
MVGLLLTVLLAVPGEMGWPGALLLGLPAGMVYGFICLSARYLCPAYPVERTAAPVLLVVHLLAGALSSSLWILLLTVWTQVLETVAGPPLAPVLRVEETRLLFGFGVALFWLAAAVHYLLQASDNRRNAEHRALELELQAREAELRALRSQVHPHFLFNSLNSIHALIAPDPGGARTMLVRLADLLRRTLSVGASTLIPLREELAIVDDYLRIEEVRFGSRLRVEHALAGEVSEWPVPPFCLLPLVENAVMHGISHLVEGGTIRITGESTQDTLTLTVTNPADGEAVRSHGTGTGLRNLGLRLESLYGRAAGLSRTPLPDGFRVQMSIPLRRPA